MWTRQKIFTNYCMLLSVSFHSFGWKFRLLIFIIVTGPNQVRPHCSNKDKNKFPLDRILKHVMALFVKLNGTNRDCMCKAIKKELCRKEVMWVQLSLPETRKPSNEDQPPSCSLIDSVKGSRGKWGEGGGGLGLVFSWKGVIFFIDLACTNSD